MTVREVLNIIDDETWAALDLPAADGGSQIVLWMADWVGADEETSAKVAPYLDRKTYDIYAADIYAAHDNALNPLIVIPVAPEESRYRKTSSSRKRK